MGRTSISVIVPVHDRARDLRKALESLARQTVREFDLVVVDDASTDDSAEVAREFTDRVVTNPANRGPAHSRNRGIALATGEIVAFLDSDCVAAPDWLETLRAALEDDRVDAVMGNTSIPRSTWLGDSIAALGYPGGANAGFATLWPVDDEGFTDHITSCNFAARRRAFEKGGVFDESFPLAGGEDSELSIRWSARGVRIRYCDTMRVDHKPVTSLRSFVSWMIYRGRAAYHLRQRTGSIEGLLKLRLRSSLRIFLRNLLGPRGLPVTVLILMMFVLQQYGYGLESRRAGGDTARRANA
jgi:GT2 family glycosyltransferase